MPRIPSLVEQIALAFVPPAPTQKRFNPRPPGVIRKGSASEAVLLFLASSPGFKTEAQIRWQTDLRHSKVSWACLYLRQIGAIRGVSDSTRSNRYLKYCATDIGREHVKRLQGETEQ